MLRPVLEYASTMWDPHTSTNINKIEAVQRRAARFSLNDFSTFSSVTNMLRTLRSTPFITTKRERERERERELNLL